MILNVLHFLARAVYEGYDRYEATIPGCDLLAGKCVCLKM